MSADLVPTGRPVGVLVMAHGTPATADQIEPFYTSIRRGSPPPPALLAELVGRYETLGGSSPLAQRTAAQVDGVRSALAAMAPRRFIVRYGAKHTSPHIEEAVATLAGDGVERIVGIVLTPHRSLLGSGEYLDRAARAAAQAAPGTPFTAVPSWHRAPGLAQILSQRTADRLVEVRGLRPGGQVWVFFTAHSLPQRVVTAGDPYPDQVGQSAADIAALLGLDRRVGVSWSVAWQSAGRTPDPWIGPDLLAEIRRVAAEGAVGVVVCPVGFVSDHLEVLYDLDVEAAGVAEEVGVAFARTTSLNDDPAFLSILAGVIIEAVGDGAMASEGPTLDPATSS